MRNWRSKLHMSFLIVLEFTILKIRVIIQLSKNLKLSPSTEFHTNTEKQIQIDYMNRQIKRRNEKREKLIDKIWNEIFIYQAKFEVKLPLEMWEHIFKFI